MPDLQPAPTPEAQAPAEPQRGGDPMKMHALALQAEKALEGLATEMGRAQAPDQVVRAVGQMADAMRKILASMAKAPTPAPQAQPEQRPTMASATNDLAQAARR